APYAFHASYLDGLGINDLIQVSGDVTQANLITLTGGGDASARHNHDSDYAQLGSSNTFNGRLTSSSVFYTTGTGKIGVGTSTGSADIQIRQNSPSLRFEMISGGTGNSRLEFYSGTVERAKIESSETTNQLVFSTGGVTALTID